MSLPAAAFGVRLKFFYVDFSQFLNFFLKILQILWQLVLFFYFFSGIIESVK